MTEPIPFHRAAIGEEEIRGVTEVIESGWLTTGSRVREFEERFAEKVGAPHAVAVNSATAALHLSLAASGVGPGDEVIVPTMTFAATAEVVTAVGATIVLADCDPSTLNITADLIAERMSPRTAAVMPVHYGGRPCDMDLILDLAGSRGLAVFEDAAHAFPASYRGRPIGSIGTATSFSFYANKTITTGEGGMLTTADEGLAARARMLSLHGLSKDAWRRFDRGGSWEYDIVAPGYKYNLTDIAAAMGLAQLGKADDLLARRRALALRYVELVADVPGVTPLAGHEDGGHAWHLFVIRLEGGCAERDRLAVTLQEADIGISVHYKPLHRHPLYAALHDDAELPNASAAADQILSLPLFPGMTFGQQDRVVDELARAVERS
jgi:dTDP-4-amino-4,6-dideoxygalactose transaminase